MGFPKEKLRSDQGVTLLESQVTRYEPFFSHIYLLSGDRGIDANVLNRPVSVVADPPEMSGQGPLVGLLAGLEACATEQLLLLPVDQPFFPLEMCQADPVEFARVFRDNEARLQWMGGTYHRRLIPLVRDYLQAGHRSLGGFVKSLGERLEVKDCLQHQAFFNLNTPEEAAAAGFQRPTGVPSADRER